MKKQTWDKQIKDTNKLAEQTRDDDYKNAAKKGILHKRSKVVNTFRIRLPDAKRYPSQ